MNKIDLTKEHNKLVRELQKQIQSLGLILMSHGGVFSEGFRPDIVINVGGCKDDWVIIDVINSRRQITHDIGGLLTVKANVENIGYPVRGIIAVFSDRIRTETITKHIYLIRQHPNFIITQPSDFKDTIQDLMVQSAKEKLDKLGYITSYILKKPETQKKE